MTKWGFEIDKEIVKKDIGYTAKYLKKYLEKTY
jgi:hypothetical protein